MLIIEVVAALIKHNDKYLCCQRPAKGEVGLMWEFPGGKIELGETNEEALKREIEEELSMEIVVGNFITTVTHQYNSFHLTMHCYLCSVESRKYILNEHLDAKWLSVDEMADLNWAPADIPVLEKLN